MMINGKDLEIGPGVDLSYADLGFAVLTATNLKNANLKGVDLIGSDLENANLSGANLTSADLKNANLKGTDLTGTNITDIWMIYCIGDGEIIKNIPYLRWKIVYTKDVMAIGCEQHTIDQWKRFTDDEIDNMSERALKFWKKHKSQILEEVLKS